jgi:hypothetical protein
MKKYNLLVKKINHFERLAQELNEPPYTMMSEKEHYGEGNNKKDLEVPNAYITNLMRDSYTKYNTLSPEEQKAIDWWIASSDQIKNHKDYKDDKVHQIAQKFNETLKKFWIQNPTEKHPLIRRTRNSVGEIQKMLKDGEITLHDNTSASYKSMDKFGPNEFIFRYVSQAYSLIGPNNHEAEMIIPAGTKFKILSSKPNRGGYTIELTEIN